MSKKYVTRIVAVLVAAGTLFAGAACGNTNSSASLPKPVQSPKVIDERKQGTNFMRVKFYNSLDELKKDSPVIVTGIVTKQKTALDVDHYSHVTLSDVRVLSVEKGSVKPNQTVTILQEGTRERESTASSFIFKKGEVGLFFINKIGDGTKLGGDLDKFDDDYAIRGVHAGVYMLSDVNNFTTLATTSNGSSSSKDAADSVPFTRRVITEGDSLPNTITPKDCK